jgi:gliding motility-associated-like protein
MKYVLQTLLMLFVVAQVNAQTCTTPGQTPETAFPVCGTKTFTQASVPKCGGREIPGIACPPGHTDINPFWYKFTCYTTGTLGFLITPHDLSEDYDWQLFDVTNRPLSQVYTNNALFVASGWSGESGLTGASSAGANREVCGGFGNPLFSAMPTIHQGHDYLLLISHFDEDSESGYTLKFDGGTASITDPVTPQIQNVFYDCTIPAIRVKLNKRVQCSSLAANGSDFALAGSPGAVITGATGVTCNNGFDLDSVVLTLSAPLPAGNYSLSLKAGTDGNTVLDPCGNAGGGAGVPPRTFTVLAQQPSLFDHIVPVSCMPNKIRLVLNQPVRCNSVAANGSDFVITGATPVTIQSASVLRCNNGLSDTIELQLANTIYRGGAYQVALRAGSDGNTLLSECWVPTPAGGTAPFNTSDTVNADFTYTMTLDCEYDTVRLSHPGGNGVNSWSWSSDGEDPFSTEQNPIKAYSVFGQHTIKLVVSNGTCSDSASTGFLLDNELNASFTSSLDILCPQEVTQFTNTSTGKNIIGYLWNFGNGIMTTTPTPLPQGYPQISEEKEYLVSLIIQSSMNCFDTATHVVKAVPSCYIDVPTAFSPNGDGVNDYLYPLNGYKALNLRFSVFNRLGQLIFESTDWRYKWDGTLGGRPQGIGTYVWMLSYTHKDSGQKVFKKGVAVLVR